jgi:hypothetical protein|tara:strand:- start:3012 stop:3194 length:183 start_codon:yes stop_codon:yes gene_type:complete
MNTKNQKTKTSVTLELDGIEAIETIIPALLRKQDEVSHKLAGLIIKAVSDKWTDATNNQI